jgi:hypothetical protein
MAVVPIILLLVAGAVIAGAQLMVQTDSLVLSLLMLVPLVPAILLSRLRSAPSRLTALQAGPDLPRRMRRGV